MKYPVFDGHCDTALELYAAGDPSLAHAKGHVTLQAMTALHPYAQFFAFCPVSFPEHGDPAKLYDKSLAAFQNQLQLHNGIMTLCGNFHQLHNAWEQGKTAVFLSIEGAEAICCDPGRLEQAAMAGIRMIAPVWNGENSLSGTNVTDGGLTPRGREFIRRAQELGIIVDVSHISDRAFFEICDLTQAPVVASHSNSRAVCNHKRNLTDEQFRLIVQMGGTVGINLYPLFLREDGRASYHDIYIHLEHFLSLGGEDTVALGGDMDGIPTTPEGFKDIRNYKDIAEFLESRGLPSALLKKLCAGNLMRILDTCFCKPV